METSIMLVCDDPAEHHLNSMRDVAWGDDTLGHPAAWHMDRHVNHKSTAVAAVLIWIHVIQDAHAKLGVSTACVEQPLPPAAGHQRMSKHRGGIRCSTMQWYRGVFVHLDMCYWVRTGTVRSKEHMHTHDYSLRAVVRDAQLGSHTSHPSLVVGVVGRPHLH